MKRGILSRISNSRYFWIVVYAVYLSIILASVQAFIAEDSVNDIREDMDKSYDYDLLFEKDGKTTHYDVARHDTGMPGRITLTYWTQDNKLDITKVDNIKTLKIDVQSMFEDESNKVFKKEHSVISTMDMDYWLEAGDGIFTIDFNIPTLEPMENLTFTKFPEPKSVLVNNQQWWKTSTNYSIFNNEISISNIPTGKTTVILYFKDLNKIPTAAFTTNPSNYAGVNEDITFNGGSSSDPDGEIKHWLWTFGDDESDSGQIVTHKYIKPGNYTIRLTVRDDAEPFGEDWVEKTMTVAFGAEDDFDSDGLRDLWEWDHFNDLEETGLGDPDRDGASNKAEHDAGTDPTDPESKPKGKEKATEPTDMDLSVIIAVIIIVIVILVILMVVLRSKKSKAKEKAQDEEEIAEMEAKIAQAKKLGLPTRELERLLKEAKEGKPFEVEPVEEKKKPAKGKPKGKAKGKPGGKTRSKGRTGSRRMK